MNPGAIIVINEQNVNKMIDNYEYFKSLNLGMKINPMFNDGAAKGNSYMNLNPDDYIRNFISFFKYWSTDIKCNINVSTCMELVNLIINNHAHVCTYNSCLGKWLCLDSNGHLYPCDRLCIEKYDLGDISNIDSIDEAFENEKFINLLKEAVQRRDICSKKCDDFNECYGGCNANAILSQNDKIVTSCYIQKGILKELKKYLLELKDEKEYDRLNPNLSKIMKRSYKK